MVARLELPPARQTRILLLAIRLAPASVHSVRPETRQVSLVEVSEVDPALASEVGSVAGLVGALGGALDLAGDLGASDLVGPSGDYGIRGGMGLIRMAHGHPMVTPQATTTTAMSGRATRHRIDRIRPPTSTRRATQPGRARTTTTDSMSTRLGARVSAVQRRLVERQYIRPSV